MTLLELEIVAEPGHSLELGMKDKKRKIVFEWIVVLQTRGCRNAAVNFVRDLASN